MSSRKKRDGDLPRSEPGEGSTGDIRRETSSDGVPEEPKKEAVVEVDALQKRLDEAERLMAEYRDEAARAKADFYNYRTRVERDRARDRTLAAEQAVDALLPVMDNLERALKAVEDKASPLFKGVEMVQRQFFSTLQGLGLAVIDCDGPFDPSFHDAVAVVEVEDDRDGTIVEELHRGYMLGDKVLRAAQVRVGRKASK